MEHSDNEITLGEPFRHQRDMNLVASKQRLG